jgi:hypothetical protein
MENFSDLIGKTITKITGGKPSDDIVTFETSDGSIYKMLHYQDCCESVLIDDVVGDLEDLLNTPILSASEDVNPDEKKDCECAESCTWTFYNIGTIKGFVTIKWFGTSNGYYSEGVSFFKSK